MKTSVERPGINTGSLREQVRATFRRSYGLEAVMICAPGRINLIGEHTDYNDGFALPGAVDLAVWLAMRPRSDGKVRILSMGMHRSYEGALSKVSRGSGSWPKYVLGVVNVVQQRSRKITGFDLVYGSDIPSGTGLSSSSALACGIILGLDAMLGLGTSRAQIAALARLAEEEYVGTRSGCMDPNAIIFGAPSSVLFLDSRDASHVLIPFPEHAAAVVLCDSQAERTGAAEQYNVRRAQCHTGVGLLRRFEPRVSSLRDVSATMLARHAAQLPPTVLKRCEFVVSENRRVLEAANALARRDMRSLGKLMLESHEGVRRQYEVSCRELDVLVNAAATHPGTFGARMMGTGFGGCTVNLVKPEALASFIEHMTRTFEERLGRHAAMYACSFARGAHVVA